MEKIYYTVHFDDTDWSGIFDNREKCFKALDTLGPYTLEDCTGDEEVWNIKEDGIIVGYVSVIDMNSIITSW